MVLTNDEAAAINAVETQIDDAYRNGLVNGTLLPPVAGISKYTSDDDFGQGDADKANANRTLLKNPFKAAIAAMMRALNIKKAFPNALPGTVTINYTKADASTGTLTFTDGILTAST